MRKSIFNGLEVQGEILKFLTLHQDFYQDSQQSFKDITGTISERENVGRYGT